MNQELLETHTYLTYPENSREFDAIYSVARDLYLDAESTNRDVQDYMKESVLDWLQYHADIYDSFEDIDVDEIEAVNHPSTDQQSEIIQWAWEFNLDISDMEFSSMEELAVTAAQHLELSAVRALVEIHEGVHDEELYAV